MMKIITKISLLALFVLPLGLATTALAAVNVTTDPATAITSSDATLNATNGANPASGHSFWVSLAPFSTASPVIPAGAYSTIDFGPIAAGATFSAPLSSATGMPAVTPNTTYYFAGWSNVGGTWYPGEILNFTTAPAVLPGTLLAQDFGVMDFSGVKGYSAGFGLTGAGFTGATSIVIQLYSGSTLLQTNTATNPAEFPGATQISSPFDVFGTFNYVTDGYWTNVRGSEYGQTLIPTRVVATVTLANGKVVTAENTLLTGDPATIFPVILPGTLSAEDFGVVNYNTGLGMLKGYTAGFGLAGNTLAGATSVVVKLYSAGDVLLQTNTAIIPKFNLDITGTQFSSPFDVSGTFAYATDGYWTNVREAQYGQSVPATKVVATVTLANGKVVTATNTNLIGDPTTIYPIVPVTQFTLIYTAGANGSITGITPQTVNQGSNGTAVTAVANPGYHFVNWSDLSTSNPRTDSNVQANLSVTANFALDLIGPPTNKNQCKNNGWHTFNNPGFKNQGQCVSYVQANEHSGKR